MKCSEEKIVVPAVQGFYVVSPIFDDSDEAVIDIYYEPIVAWSIDPDGEVRPIAYGLPDEDCEVLCPNGVVVTMGGNLGSLAVWLAHHAAARRRAGKV